MLQHAATVIPVIVWRTAVRLLVDALSFVAHGFRSRSRLAAENMFLRQQLALYRSAGSSFAVPMMQPGSSSSCSRG